MVGMQLTSSEAGYIMAAKDLMGVLDHKPVTVSLILINCPGIRVS